MTSNTHPIAPQRRIISTSSEEAAGRGAALHAADDAPTGSAPACGRETGVDTRSGIAQPDQRFDVAVWQRRHNLHRPGIRNVLGIHAVDGHRMVEGQVTGNGNRVPGDRERGGRLELRDGRQRLGIVALRYSTLDPIRHERDLFLRQSLIVPEVPESLDRAPRWHPSGQHGVFDGGCVWLGIPIRHQ
jgi:hypothetical protein